MFVMGRKMYDIVCERNLKFLLGTEIKMFHSRIRAYVQFRIYFASCVDYFSGGTTGHKDSKNVNEQSIDISLYCKYWWDDFYTKEKKSWQNACTNSQTNNWTNIHANFWPNIYTNCGTNIYHNFGRKICRNSQTWLYRNSRIYISSNARLKTKPNLKSSIPPTRKSDVTVICALKLFCR